MITWKKGVLNNSSGKPPIISNEMMALESIQKDNATAETDGHGPHISEAEFSKLTMSGCTILCSLMELLVDACDSIYTLMGQFKCGLVPLPSITLGATL
ncbi:hypothetical protein NPIL_342591 [Nephila pilipes]|uniref:Uncharacterized protein n=1 Tax=Nephila pilipes TaxID=299642 RepID=A0A8X6PUH1_NEPPI|nr:hypothetical protein NPIL_342591 [Nephila pilipes]